jgi:hypothetical protein
METKTRGDERMTKQAKNKSVFDKWFNGVGHWAYGVSAQAESEALADWLGGKVHDLAQPIF